MTVASGVASTEYSFDGTTWNTYTGPFTIAGEGTTAVGYRSTDNAGNVEGTRSETVKIDKTAPNITVTPPQDYQLYRVGTALNFSADDAVSGLAQVWGELTEAATDLQNVNTGYVPDIGVYTLVVCASDQAGNSAESEPAFFVVYDPQGGFVSGSGWIYSERGAFVADPTLEGRANFGFVSKYKKGATVPGGNTEFVFQAGDLSFHSSSYDWLVVTGSNYARFKGTGTINGFGDYKFQIWAGDNAPDTFHIRIWEEDEVTGEEWDVYDNGSDQTIEGGSIVVHTN